MKKDYKYDFYKGYYSQEEKLSDEGRFIHNPPWEGRLSYWMKHKLGITA